MLIDAATQMKSENMMLSKISQAQRQKRGYQKLGRGRDKELLFNVYQVWDDENVLEIDSGNGCTTL